MKAHILVTASLIVCGLASGDGTARAGEYAIRITSPAFWAELTGPRVLVHGTVQAPVGAGKLVLASGEHTEGLPANLNLAAMRNGGGGLAGLRALGLIAAVEGGQFAVLVPAREGDNVITVTAGDLTSERVRTSVTVHVTDVARDASRLDPNPVAGMVPFRVNFNPTLRGRELDFDFEGDGVVDAMVAADASVAHLYEQPGLFFPTFTLHRRPDTKAAHAVTMIVDAYPAPDLVRVWQNLKAALERGDAESAMQFVACDSRSRYRPVFAALAAEPSKVEMALTEIQARTFGRETAEFEMRRSVNGTTSSFPVAFIRDYDGIWRLKSL